MNFKQDRAIYLQIADYITENILSGKWKENDRLPSVRDMAVSIEVNPNTVAHTYNYLQERGIIYNQRGIGYFVADNAPGKTKTLERETFIQEQLPGIFKTMILLDIGINEIKEMYDAYKKNMTVKSDTRTGTSPEKPGPPPKEKR